MISILTELIIACPIYSTTCLLNKVNTSNTEAPIHYLDWYLSISSGAVSSKIYDKQDGSEFDILKFPF